MAIKTFYFKNAVPTGATLHRSLQDGGTAPTAATTTTGWNAGTNAAGRSALQNGGTEVARTAGLWSTTLQPAQAPSQTLGDAWRSENTLNGTFANTNWTFNFGVRSVTAAFTGRFRLAVRVWASADANGVGAVELTAGRVTSAITAANLSTSADTTVSITWTPGATETLTNQYLFVQVGIEITTAGGGTTQDINFRVASTYTLVTPDFQTAVSGALAVSEQGSDTFASTGDVFVEGSLIATETGSDTFASTGEVLVDGALAVTETGSDAFESTGGVLVRGNLISSEATADTFSASGTVAVNATGSLAVTETGTDTLAATGNVVVQGSLAVSEAGADLFDSQGSTIPGDLVGDLHGFEAGSDTLASSGKVLVAGSMSATDSPDSFASSGKVLVQGSLTSSETGSDLFDSQGATLPNDTVGDLHGFEAGSDTLASTGKVAVNGSLSFAETGTDTLAFAGDVLVKGSAHVTESNPDALASTGKVLVSGELAGQEIGSDAFSGTAADVAVGSLAASEFGQDTARLTGSTKEETQDGGGRHGYFRPVREVTVRIEKTAKVAASSRAVKSRVTASATAYGWSPGVKARSQRASVHRPIAIVAANGGASGKTIKPKVIFDFVVRQPANTGFSGATLPVSVNVTTAQIVAAGIHAATLGTRAPAVKAVINPKDDEVLVVMTMLKQRRQRQMQEIMRKFK